MAYPQHKASQLIGDIEEMGFSQRAIAERVGVTTTHISLVKARKRDASDMLTRELGRLLLWLDTLDDPRLIPYYNLNPMEVHL